MHVKTAFAVAGMALLGAAAIGPSARAGQLLVVAPFTGVSLLQPLYPPPPQGAEAYSATAGAPLQWGIAQWSNPGGAMPPFTARQVGGSPAFTTQGEASGVTVIMKPGGSTLELSQDGRVLPCLTDKGSPREFDLFGQPNGPKVPPPRKPGLPLLEGSNPPLSGFASVIWESDTTMTQGLAASRKGCKVNQANTAMNVVLTDAAANPPQTFFYQLLFSHLCGDQPDVKMYSCNARHDKMEVFSTKSPFGTNDFLPLNGIPWLAQSRTAHVRVDLLPRLIAAIQENRGAIDRDISHWSIRSIYFGQAIYGDVTMRSTWEKISMVAETR